MASGNAPKTKGKTTKLFQQDVVQKISSPDRFGIILRCWHDSEFETPPAGILADPLMRPLEFGEVGVSYIANGGDREILSESELRLVDRTLQPGDYCKRSFDDVRAGVVTNIKVKGHIAHAINDKNVLGWRTLEDLEDRADAEIGDYITYDDWIGQVIEVYDESTVQDAEGMLVHIPGIASRLMVGETHSNLLPGHIEFGFFENKSKNTVLIVKHVLYAIAWLALNQTLDPRLAEKKTRPQRFWYGEDLAKLTLIRGRSDLEMRVGDRVHLKDETGVPYTEHGKEEALRVYTCLVTETATEIDVLWQDGSRETVKSIDVIPYLNPDEYDAWPGDHVVLKNEGEPRPAIVQSVNAVERTGMILFPDTFKVELASLLELDPHGSDHDLEETSEGFGVRRGQFVFIHPPGTTNGSENPKVPRIGEVESWVREPPLMHGIYSGWRKEMTVIGASIAFKRNDSDRMVQRPAIGDGKLSWCGEVTNLNLDGSVEVTHPDWTVATYPLERLTRLYDGIEQLEDEVWDAGSDDYHSDYSDDGSDQAWAMDQDGIWRPQEPSDEWEDVDSIQGMDVDENDTKMEDEDGDDIMEVDAALWENEALSDNNGTEQSRHETTTEKPFDSSEPEASSSTDFTTSNESENDFSDTTKWNRFEISSSTPRDHAFFSSAHSQPSKSFIGRLSKEYRVLRSSLPDSILVRAYEDRTDLLRCLIIGPENTPYQDAPFVIDWMLDSNFPQSPPIAHFHSWTNGNGRVNPNLYEEGKVCLSILGTWSGDKNEVWSAARSSLLQAFVSIQGLVLVKEPWFCEPAYDKLRGTDEGTVNSRLYNEKAYVLSRGFVRRALETPIGGIEAEIAYLYRDRQRLQKVVDDAEKLIQKSRQDTEISPDDCDLAVPRLSAGGIIALERTLIKLRNLLQVPSTGS